MNLLVTGAWQQAVDCLEQLKKYHNVIFMKWEKDELPCEYEWVEGIIGNGIFLTHPIERFTNLHYIQLTSVGYDRVPMDYVKQYNIEIYNAKGVYSIPMAEFAISGVLQLYKQSRCFYKNQEQHKWEKERNLLELYGKKVCMIGCGDVAHECAKRFQAFGCEVIGINRTQKAENVYNRIVDLTEMDQILPDADVIVLTIALTKDTYHLIDEKCFDEMKNTAIFVNLARGAVVDTKAMIRKLPSIGGAVLDVFEEEPLPEESELWEMENVIVTPHNSFVGDGNEERLKKVIFKNLEKR